jgi:hypothetical protein
LYSASEEKRGWNVDLRRDKETILSKGFGEMGKGRKDDSHVDGWIMALNHGMRLTNKSNMWVVSSSKIIICNYGIRGIREGQYEFLNCSFKLSLISGSKLKLSNRDLLFER